MFSRINFLNGFNPKMSFLEKWVNFGEYAKRMGSFLGKCLNSHCCTVYLVYTTFENFARDYLGRRLI